CWACQTPRAAHTTVRVRVSRTARVLGLRKEMSIWPGLNRGNCGANARLNTFTLFAWKTWSEAPSGTCPPIPGRPVGGKAPPGWGRAGSGLEAPETVLLRASNVRK